jgi:hypothetical protein
MQSCILCILTGVIVVYLKANGNVCVNMSCFYLNIRRKFVHNSEHEIFGVNL